MDFFDGTKGSNVPLKDFPELFTMEVHNGFCGFLFSIAWGLAATAYVPSMWPDGGWPLWLVAGLLPAGFVMLAWISTALGSYFRKQIEALPLNGKPEEEEKKLNRQARKGITWLSAGYILACCGLIWMTDGAVSPFTPFYVMVFTLTIARCKMPYPGVWVLSWFLAAILITCIVAKHFNSLIPRADLAQIEQSTSQYYMYTLFICASLIVPAVSAWLVARKNPQRQVPANSAVQHV